MSKPLAIVLADYDYEDLELHYPRLRLIEDGFEVKIVGKEKKAYKSKHQYDATVTQTFDEVDPKQVKVLVIPGGWCPDRLRRYPECTKLVRDTFEAGGIVAMICHGGWVGISAKIVKGKKVTGFVAIKDDLENAGAHYSSDRCVVDGNLVTAQTPDDLPAFMQAIIKTYHQK
eukprot:Phypoly_transcript_18923.p1 GENE.Phypoly_transcript_18923~~Phypoly_transcript_18923.p1  ORF type:complete len:172 (+),score=29.72 Phypoly_transcript_18923:214-729(+)